MDKKKVEWWLSGGPVDPTVQASSVVFTAKTDTTLTFNWTDGNGTSRIVLMKAGGAVDANPSDGSTYTANAAFGSGSQIGTGNYVVKLGSGPVTVTGLTASTTYHVAVYEFNSPSSYLTTSPATGNNFTWDTDFNAWLVQVLSDGGTDFASAVKTAQNNLVVSLKSGGFWTRCKWGYMLHCGDTTVGRRNIKSPSTLRMTIQGTLVFSESNGTKSNGTNGYFDQGFAANNYAGIESDITMLQYISESSTSQVTQASHGMATNTGGSLHRFNLNPKVSVNGSYYHYQNGSNSWANANHKGRYIQTYNSGNSVMYKDGSSVASNAVTPIAPNIAANRFILARNTFAGAVPTPTEYYTFYLAYDFGFDTVSGADAAAIDAIFATYNTAAGLP